MTNQGFLALFGSMLVGFGAYAPAIAQAPSHDCEVRAEGVVTPSGNEFNGAISQLMGADLFTWVHRAPGLLLEVDGPPIGGEVNCRQNGGVVADAHSIGAVLNGTPGYSVAVHLVDNGPPSPDFIPLCAKLVREPVRERSDYTLSFAPPRTVIIPGELRVLRGSAGTGSARLTLDNHTCRYQGDGFGPDYLFERCTGPDGKELLPGDALDVSNARLRIQSSDSSAPVTYVETNIGTRPFIVADTYSILIGDATGEVFYSEAGDLGCGDIKAILF